MRWENKFKNVIFLLLFLFLITAACVSNNQSQEQNSRIITKQSLPNESPKMIGQSKIIAISTSLTHHLALHENGTVIAWNEGEYGKFPCRLGVCDIPENLTDVIEIGAGESYSVALTKEGKVVVWGCKWDPPPPSHPDFFVSANDSPCRVPANLTHVKSISAGRSHILAIKEDGTVVAWGSNQDNKCKVPRDLKNVTAVSAGDTFSMALKEDGHVSAWGGYIGQIPYGSYKGIAAGQREGLLLTANGTLATFTDARAFYSPFDPIYYPNVTNVSAISAGDRFFMALLENGTVIFWGYTGPFRYRTWGNLSELHNITSISSQDLNGIALKDDGSVIIWGM